MRTLMTAVALYVLLIWQAGPSPSVTPAFAVAFPVAFPVTVGRPLLQATDVSLETPTGTLFGTLLRPSGNGPFPVVLLVAGSGPTDRDGNSVGLKGKSNCLKLLAEGLAENGIASLRYDKRGVARSAPARATPNSFDIQAEDAARWVAWLGQSRQFRAIGIVGHSEGAFVGTIAAQGGGARALVSLAGAGRRFDDVLVEQMKVAVRAGQLSQASLNAMQGVLAELRAGRAVKTRPPNIPDELWTGLFQPRAQEYLLSLFRYDPVEELARLSAKGVRVMIVQGTTDLMGGRGDPDLLAAAVGVKPVLIEGMNHELKSAPLDPGANDKASVDPWLPLAPGLLSQIAAFLNTALQ